MILFNNKINLLSTEILVIFCLFFTLGFTKWDYRAAQIYGNPAYQHLDCRHRVMILAEEMIKNAKVFDIVLGRYDGKPHCWIVFDGKILDPSVDGKGVYKTINKFKITNKEGLKYALIWLNVK